MQIALFDHHAAPHCFEQLVLRHHPPGALDQRNQQIEGPAAEGERKAV